MLQLDAAIGTDIAQKVFIFDAIDSRSFRGHDLHLYRNRVIIDHVNNSWNWIEDEYASKSLPEPAHWDGIEIIHILCERTDPDRLRIVALVYTSLKNILFILHLVW